MLVLAHFRDLLLTIDCDDQPNEMLLALLKDLRQAFILELGVTITESTELSPQTPLGSWSQAALLALWQYLYGNVAHLGH